MEVVVDFKRKQGVPAPVRAHDDDAGLDMKPYGVYHIPSGGTSLVGTGIHVAIPKGYVGLLFARSSLHKRSLRLANGVGVIDSGYRGEIKAAVQNYGKSYQEVKTSDDAIVQLVIVPIPEVHFNMVPELDDTDRGTGGFGSTDRK